MIHVPLLIEGPGVVPRRVARPVSLLDLAPTVLSLFGAETPGHFMGQSLVPFMRGEDVQLARPIAADGSRGIRAMLFEERYKAIVDDRRGTEELYDLREDPRERRNLAERPDAARHFATLRAFFGGLSPKQGDGEDDDSSAAALDAGPPSPP
jgi:choline-sulfatase